MPEAKEAPVEESKETKKDGEVVTPPAEDKTPAEDKKETIGDALGDKKPIKESKSVPEAAFVELKKENKEFKKQIEALQKQIESGATKKDVSKSIQDIADKHNVDATFLTDFATAVRKEAEQDFEDKVSNRLSSIEEKDRQEKVDKIFSEHFDKTLEEYPEYKKVVNKEVIKTLALNPANKDKTFIQIFEESYGHLVTGKKTLDTTKPRGGKNAPTVDFKKASTDSEYFKEIMADPELKKQYNEGLAERLPI